MKNAATPPVSSGVNEQNVFTSNPPRPLIGQRQIATNSPVANRYTPHAASAVSAT